MKRVKFVGEYEVTMPTINVQVKPGDVIEVEDTFDNALFVLEEKIKVVKGDNN